MDNSDLGAVRALVASDEAATHLHPSGVDHGEPYENTLTVEQLRREVRELWDQEAALTDDFRNLPEVPSTDTMRALSNAAMQLPWPHFWGLGKDLQQRARDMQRGAGIDAFDMGNGGVPWKCEYECAAGLWAVIRAAIAMETQRAETTGSVGVADDSAAIAQGDGS